MEEAEPSGPSPAGRPSRRWLRVAGLLVAALAVALCLRAVTSAWPDVRHRLATARADDVLAAAACSAGAMVALALTWWRCLHVFGLRVAPVDAIAWHFGGELGKYVPGGVWTVVGRGELARRGGVPRSTSYATTLISYAVTCVAAGSVGALFAAVTAARDSDLWWGWALLVLLPIGLVSVHPAAVERVLRLVGRLGRRPLELPVPGWPAMVQLVGCSAPAWVFMGAAAAFTTHALGVTQDPVRVAFAAVAAWLVGFLAVPVPAGVGVREVVFVVLCGLPAGPATAVAAITRGLLVLVDAVGGFAALATVGRRRVRA